jgi:hypothetical protein
MDETNGTNRKIAPTWLRLLAAKLKADFGPDSTAPPGPPRKAADAPDSSDRTREPEKD